MGAISHSIRQPLTYARARNNTGHWRQESWGYLRILSMKAIVFQIPKNIIVATHFHSTLSRSMMSPGRAQGFFLLYLIH